MSDDAMLDKFNEKSGKKENVADEHPRFESLPHDWKISEIASIAEVVGGSTPSTSNKKYWDGGIPWATPTDITALSGNTISETEDTITKKGLESASTHLLPPKSVLMTSRATIGECAVNTIKMATNQGFKNLVPSDEIEHWYLYYRMLDTAGFLNSLGSGSTFDEISKTDVQSVDIPIPPLSEQRKIATVLHTVDQAIQKTEELIDTYEAVQKGILRDSISRGVTEDGEFRTDSDEAPDLYSETRWGQIPKAWDTENVSELVADDRSVTYGIVKAGEHVPGGVPMIRGENYISGWEPLSEFFRVSEEIHKEYNRSAVRSGDILLAVAGANAGAVNIVPDWMPDEVNISRSTARISVDGSDVIPEFMRNVIESPFLRKQIHAWKKGSAQDVLNLGDVKKFQVPLPPIDEQNRIVSIISNIREGELKERTIKKQYSRLKRGLMQDLLSGEVRTTDVNIDIPQEVAKYA
jgi:type I restriction enzyme S subunit